MLPPEIQAIIESDQEIPPEIQQQMQQAQQAMQQVQQHGQLVQAAADELEQEKSLNEKQKAEIKTEIANLRTAKAEFDANIANQLSKLVMKEAGISTKAASATQKMAGLYTKSVEVDQNDFKESVDTTHALDEIMANFMVVADKAMAGLEEKAAVLERKTDRKPIDGKVSREGGRLTANVKFDDGTIKTVNAVRDKGQLRIVPEVDDSP
jgi:chromosome segregation ATPase